MNQPLLSILIPITPDRKDVVQNLLQVIGVSIGLDAYADNSTWARRWVLDDKPVEVVMYQDNKELTLGEKREELYKAANGIYSWQVDSDDNISDDAIDLILDAIWRTPDCITFHESCVMNGKYHTCRHSLEYDDWHDDYDGYNFVRTPFYKNVIKTEIARSVPFERIRYGEDHAWSRGLKPHLKTEVHIPKELYFYQHNSKPEEFNERYGFNV